MALAKDTIKKIATLLRVKEEDITAAIANEAETALEIPEVQTFTAAELSTRDSATGNKKYNEGKEAGVEMFIKEQKKTLGLEFEGKDGSAFLKAVQDKTLADAKVTPAEHEKTISKLRESVQTFESKVKDLEGQIKTRSLLDKVKAELPKNGLGLSAEDTIAILQNRGISFEEVEGGGLVVKKGGEIMQDSKLATPLAPKDALTSIFTENNWLEKEAPDPKKGRGAGSSQSSTGLPSTLTEAEKEWVASGKNAQGQEFQAHVSKLAKENPSFDMAA